MAWDGERVIDATPHTRTRLTAEEFMVLCEGGAFGDLAHIELIDGELVEMPPEGSGHAMNGTRTLSTLMGLLAPESGLSVTTNMAIKLGPGRVVGPDVVVFERPQGRPSTVPAAAVHLAVEHAYSSRKYDLETKSLLYAQAGVPELWVVDNVKNLLHRFHSPSNGRYVAEPPIGLDARIAVPFAAGETIAVRDLLDLD